MTSRENIKQNQLAHKEEKVEKKFIETKKSFQTRMIYKIYFPIFLIKFIHSKIKINNWIIACAFVSNGYCIKYFIRYFDLLFPRRSNPSAKTKSES